MIQTPLSAATYQANVLADLQATGITQTNEGGKARAIADAIGDQIGTLELNQFTNLAQTLLPYATGTVLDFWGSIYGVTRIARQDASTSETDQNFEFYVRYGTFGSINNGADITIPAGTQLYTAAGLGGVVYLTQADVDLPAASSSAYFAATAQSTGASGQIAAGVIDAMSFTNYADGRYSSLLVTNNLGVVSGVDAETDDAYRYRISLKIQSLGGSQQSDVQAALLAVTGVQDVDFERLAGTFNAYIFGISPDVGATLLEACQNAINATVAWPLNGTAVAPDLVGFSLTTTATFVAGTSSAQVTQALQTAASNIQSYIDNLGKEGTLVINQIASQILQADASILDIGQPNQPITSIYIWRSRADGTRFSRTLVGDYTAALGERLVTENISNAITITQAAS